MDPRCKVRVGSVRFKDDKIVRLVPNVPEKLDQVEWVKREAIRSLGTLISEEFWKSDRPLAGVFILSWDELGSYASVLKRTDNCPIPSAILPYYAEEAVRAHMTDNRIEEMIREFRNPPKPIA